MARVSRAQTDKNRIAIEEASSRLFREQGIDGVSVADLMAAAGLTHGGFYGHFASKDALAAIACENAFKQSVARWQARIKSAGDGAAAAQQIADGFLSHKSRDHAGNGCPAVALATDVARAAPAAEVRGAYLAGIEAMLATLATLAGDTALPAGPAPAGQSPAGRQQAMVLLAALVGAQTLARATHGAPISDQILAAVRDHLQQVPLFPPPAEAAPQAPKRPRKPD